MTRIRGGYYIKARSIKESAIAHAPPYVREIWDYLLREANHSDQKYNGFIVKRGQLFRSYREIRNDLSWKVGYRTERYNENQMKMGMRYLMKQLMVTLVKQPRGNLITVCNYDYFQNPKNYDATSDATNETTNVQPMGNQGVPSINKNVKNEENKKNKDFLSDSTEYGLSELLFDEILKNNPNQKKPNLQTWAKDIDRMIRLDNRNPDDIRKIIVWAQGDTFWKSNILSAVKLRQHFDKLYLKMTGGNKGDKYDF